MREPTLIDTADLRGELRYAVAMSQHTSWRAGGKADCVYKPADLADLQVFLKKLPPDEKVLAIGLGSNLLVRDGGFPGIVILMHGALSELHLDSAGVIYAQAGVAGAKLARFAASHDLTGGEFFAGIPGTLGGMLTMNAGCYGGETWQKVARVQVLTRSGELMARTPEEYEIGYRHVVKRKTGNVKCGEQGTFHLSPFTFHEEFFVGAWLTFESGDGAASQQEIKALMEKRSASQPLQQPNAGSVFRNPPGGYAAQLIESCGLKGKRMGGAQVSEKHANFIVNAGDASAMDIENLINEVRETVGRVKGVALHPEVKIVGDGLNHG